MNKLMQTVTENVAYVVIFLAVIVGCFLKIGSSLKSIL